MKGNARLLAAVSAALLLSGPVVEAKDALAGDQPVLDVEVERYRVFAV